MWNAQRIVLHGAIEDDAETVIVASHRIDVVCQLLDGLGACTGCHVVLVSQIEVCVEIDDEVLLHKRLPSVRHIPCLQGAARQVLELLTLIHVQQQVHLVAGGFQSGRISQDDVSPVHPVLHIVDDDIVQHACLLVFVSHIQVDVLDAVIEHTLWNVQFGRFHLHGSQHLEQFQLGFRHNLVLKVESRE